jgi:threonine/homoserine/homoserine lactone efflux protein
VDWYAGALRDGVVASLTNPKGIIFLFSFLPQFVRPERGRIGMQILILGLLMKTISLAVESAISISAGLLRRTFLKEPRFAFWQERLVGIALIAISGSLIFMRNPA